MISTTLGIIAGIAHIIFWTAVVILLILLIKRRMDIKKKEGFEKRDN